MKPGSAWAGYHGNGAARKAGSEHSGSANTEPPQLLPGQLLSSSRVLGAMGLVFTMFVNQHQGSGSGLMGVSQPTSCTQCPLLSASDLPPPSSHTSYLGPAIVIFLVILWPGWNWGPRKCGLKRHRCRCSVGFHEEVWQQCGCGRPVTNKDVCLSILLTQPPPCLFSSDKLFYIYTSGTTGLPKAAIVVHSR